MKLTGCCSVQYRDLHALHHVLGRQRSAPGRRSSILQSEHPIDIANWKVCQSPGILPVVQWPRVYAVKPSCQSVEMQLTIMLWCGQCLVRNRFECKRLWAPRLVLSTHEYYIIQASSGYPSPYLRTEIIDEHINGLPYTVRSTRQTRKYEGALQHEAEARVPITYRCIRHSRIP